MKKKNIRVMLIEDHPEYREILGIALGKEENLKLINQFGTAEEAVKVLENSAPDLIPHVILLDLNLPGMSGIQALPEIIRAAPEARTIVLTQSNRESDVLKAVSLGAGGYLLKSATMPKIIDGIRAVAEGGAILDAHLALFIMNTIKARIPNQEDLDQVLTSRELEVLTMLADGHVKKQIAERLSISYKTVDHHVAHIYEKLDVRNAPAAIHKAHHLGLFLTNE